MTPPWPPGLPGLEAAWSRRVTTTDPDGTKRAWHVLDMGNPAGNDAPTLLCVHGNPTWSYLWRRILAAAPPGWRVVAVDQLGMGWSDRTPPRRLAQRIDDLGALTAALNITGPVVLAAHDWGGPISLGWALNHRDQLRGVVLTNTAVHHPAGLPWPGLLRVADTLRETVCVRTPTFVRAAAALSRPRLPRAVRRALATPYRTAKRRAAIGDFVADIPFTPDHPSRPTLDAVADGVRELSDVPVLILWGARDPVFTAAHLADLQARLPHADVQRFPQASHLVTEDIPETAELIWTWLGDLDTDRRDRRPQPVSAPSVPLWAALEHRLDDTVAVAELVDDRQQISFTGLRRRVRDLAAGLAGTGVRPGDRVALLVPPGIDLTVAAYACWRVGAVVVVADAGLGARALGRALRSAAPDHVIAIRRGLAGVAALRVPGRRIGVGPLPWSLRRALKVRHTILELEALGRGQPLPEPPGDAAEAAVLFTSGATGPAKGVVYRHCQLRAQAALIGAVCRIGRSDRFVAAFAPFALYGPVLGIPAAVPDMDVTRPGTLTATALADAVRAIDATVVFASPAALRNVVATAGSLDEPGRAALEKVATVLSAGAPVALDLLRGVQELLPAAEVHTPYGMTEAMPITDVTLGQVEDAGAGNGVCVGWPLAGVQVAVSPLDAEGCAEGELATQPEVTGEVCVAAAQVKERYDRLWTTERRSSRTPGWHRTGDVGHLDAQGRLWIEGRLPHIVSTADGVVTPVGPEQRISARPEVADAAVVGVGPTGTQQVVAVVVPAGDGNCRSVLAGAELARVVRDAAGVEVSAVLTVAALPVDIRHASKVDRSRVAGWASRVLAGERARL